jgi:hypothetical protein
MREGHTDRHTGDLISLTFLFKESRLKTIPCRLSAILYSISGGRLLHPQPDDAPCRGAVTRDTVNMEALIY